jgi:hypothetical protein
VKRVCALLSAAAALQLAIPAQAAHPTMVAICGNGAPIRLPMKDQGDGKNRGDGQSCCKICHSAMRKRFAGGNCCDGDDDEEDSGP